MNLNNINLEELYEDINLARNSNDYLTLSEQDKAKFDQLASEAFNKVRGHQRDYSALKTNQRHLEQERTNADAAALKSSVGEELRGMYDKGEIGAAEYAATRALSSMLQPLRGAVDLMTVPVDLVGIGARWLSGDRVGHRANELAENIRGVAAEYIPDTFEGADSTLGGISGQVAGGIGRFAPSMALLGGAGALGKVAAKKAVRVGVPKVAARAIPFVTKTGVFTGLKIPDLVKGREARTGEFKPGTDAAIGAVQSALFVATIGLFMNQGYSKIAALKLADTLQKTEGLGKIAAMSKHALEQGIRTGVAFGASGSAGELLRQYGQDDAIDLIQAFNTGASSAGMGFAFGIAGGIKSAYSIGKSVNDYVKRLAEEAKARLNDPAYKQAREFAFAKGAADHISKHLHSLKGDAGLAEILAALKKAEQTAPNGYVKMIVRWFAQDVKTKHDDGFFHKFESGYQKIGKDQTTPPGGTSKAGLPKEALVRRTAQPEGQLKLDYQWLERIYKGKPVDDSTAELPALKSSGYLQEPQAKLPSQNVLPSAIDSTLLLSEPQKKLADSRPKVRVQKDLTPDPDAKVSIVKHKPVAEEKTTKLKAGDASRLEKKLSIETHESKVEDNTQRLRSLLKEIEQREDYERKIREMESDGRYIGDSEAEELRANNLERLDKAEKEFRKLQRKIGEDEKKIKSKIKDDSEASTKIRVGNKSIRSFVSNGTVAVKVVDVDMETGYQATLGKDGRLSRHEVEPFKSDNKDHLIALKNKALELEQADNQFKDYKTVIKPLQDELREMVQKFSQSAPVKPTPEGNKVSKLEADLFSLPTLGGQETEKNDGLGRGIARRSAARSTQQGSTQKSSQQIEDFGEKIGGAKKDLAKSWQKELTQDDIRKLPPVKKAFDNLFKTLKSRKTDKGIELYSVEHLFAKYGAKAVKAGWILFKKGAKKFAEWAREMSRKFGKAIHKHLRNIWKDIQRVAKDRRGAVGNLKKTIREKTGQRKLADEIKSIRPSEALKWRFQRGEVDARAAVKATEKLYQPTIKRLEAEARRTGKKIDRVKQLDDNQKIVRTLIQAILPTDKRAFLLQQAANAKTIKRLQAIAEKAVNASEDYYRERELNRFKDLVKRTEKLHSMLAPDRQKLLDGLQIDEGRQALKSVRHFLNDFEKQDADFEAPSWLKRDLEDAIRSKDTRDLTPMEMEVINDSLKFLVQAQAMIKKAYIGGQWKEVDEVAADIADTLSKTKFDPGLLKRAGNKISDKYGELIHGVAPVKRTPEYGLLGHLKLSGTMNIDGHDFAEKFGAEGKKVFYDNLVEGDTVQNTVLRNTERFLQDTVSRLGLGAQDTKTFGNWINKPVMKVVDRFGKSLDVTRGEKLDIVALAEFQRARRQLADSGIVLMRDRSTNVIDVSEGWLDRLASELSPKERELKDALVAYINEEILNAINEVHQSIKAFPLVAPGSKDKYFPTSRDRAHGHRAPSDDILDDQAERLVTPSGFSFLKETRDNKYPFRIGNIISKFKDHTRKAAVYIGHAQNVRTLEMVRNYPGMESKIIRALGRENWNRLKLLSEAVSQAGNTPNTETMNHWQKLYRKIVPALLTPRSMFVQYASLGNVPAMVPAKYLVGAMVNPKNHTPTAVRKLMNDDADMWRRLSKYQSNFMFTGNLELDSTPSLLKPFTHFDGVAMVIIHEAVKSWARDTGMSQAWAQRKANEVLRLTQNTGTTPDATGTQLSMRSGKDIVSVLAGTYVSQRAKTRNLLNRIWRDKKKSKLRKATDMAVLLLTGLAFNVVADQIFSRLRGRSPDILGSVASEVFDVFVTGPHARLAGVSAYNARRLKEGRKIHGSSGFVIDQVYDLTNAFGLLIKQVYEGDASAASNIAQAIRIGAAAGVFAGIPQALITWPIEAIDAHILSESDSEDKSESSAKGKRLPDGRMIAPTKARPRTPRRPRRPKR